jgi:hypothetical protein
MHKLSPAQDGRSSPFRDPVRWILLCAATLRIIGITWGLPASDGWDDDGVAPRDFLVGVLETYTPGHFYTYPPVHLILLSVATLPVWLAKLLSAPSLEPSSIIRHFVQVPTMTALALIARLVSAAMSVATIRVMGKIGHVLGGRTAELATMIVLTLNMTLTYYGHTTNLDGPYIFWGSLATLSWISALRNGRLAHFRNAALFCALSVGTKDQAYALFVLAFPVSVLLALAFGNLKLKPTLRALFVALAIFVLVLLLLDGAVTNPSGFRARLAFLLGPASQDHAFYTKDLSGRFQIVQDVARNTVAFYPPLFFFPLLLIGFFVTLRKSTQRTAVMVPALVAVSFTLAFNLVARRTEPRFDLPQSVFFTPYVGVAAAALWKLSGPTLDRIRLVIAVRLALVGGALVALYACASVDVSLIFDPRYQVEAWLMANTKPGQSLELYGNNVYLPRIPSHLKVSRILGNANPRHSDTPKNPIPGIDEIAEPFEDHDTRKPATCGRSHPCRLDTHSNPPSSDAIPTSRHEPTFAS